MNAFKMLAEGYKNLVKQGKITEEQAKRNIEIYEFLATCDTDDFCTMVDSSAFNDIIKGFIKVAIRDFDDESQDVVFDNLRWLFDEKTSKEVLEISQAPKTREKYAVNVVFDGELEEQIRERAKEYGVGVATYIKMLVSKDLKDEK